MPPLCHCWPRLRGFAMPVFSLTFLAQSTVEPTFEMLRPQHRTRRLTSSCASPPPHPPDLRLTYVHPPPHARPAQCHHQRRLNCLLQVTFATGMNVAQKTQLVMTLLLGILIGLVSAWQVRKRLVSVLLFCGASKAIHIFSHGNIRSFHVEV